MKYLIVLLLIMPLFSQGQEEKFPYGLPVKDGNVVFEYVINTPGIKEEVIYAAIQKWIVEKNYETTFKNSPSASIDATFKFKAETQDIATGQIIGIAKGSIQQTEINRFLSVGTLRFLVQIDCRDNKYRLRFYSIQLGMGEIYSDRPFQIAVFGEEGKYVKPKLLKDAQKSVQMLDDYFNTLAHSLSDTITRSGTEIF